MQIPKNFNPEETEAKLYKAWTENDLFSSEPDKREPYTVVLPPPNVTGVLHMGHTLNTTIQDILIRKARMEGKNACWVPGTDHASIATEARVVNMLREKGIDKNKISREEFLKHAYEWKDKYGNIIFKQMKMLGASCDWDRAVFTMDEAYYKSVIKVFNDLYEKGLIYRGARIINWDPAAKTALSDEEVYHKETSSNLYHISYKIEGADEEITIATTRPETILGDTAVCVHPEDERYKHLHGKFALVPLINRKIPIITDTYVDREFGSGALKVTPAHDENDYKLGLKHKLESIDIFNEDGSLNEAAKLYIGKDRFEARKLIVNELKEQSHLSDIEEIQNSIAYSERTDAVVEPRFSTQWFCKMESLSKPALKAVMEEELKFFPPKFKNMYRHWMENIRDWCISRQLWWGQRIPAYYLADGSYVVAENEKEALEKAKKQSGNSELTSADIRQDEDVLDTWFSSWIWPIAVFDGINNPDNAELNYYYPTNTLVTAPEIIFFWVARMIMSGYEYKQERPFKHVYFTGIVRDKQGRKMSKSLGNSPDMMQLIKTYGADGVRFAILVCSPAGNDLLFDEKLCDQGRNFSNKIWNALRLVDSWESGNRISEQIPEKQQNQEEIANEWFENRLAKVLEELERYYESYRVSDAMMSVYKCIWDDFCSWYLEMIKPGKDEKISRQTYQKACTFFENLMKLLHPFMPFITEEIWQKLSKAKDGDFLMVSEYPKANPYSEELLMRAQNSFSIIREIRNAIREHQIQSGTDLVVKYKVDNDDLLERWKSIICKLTKIADLESVSSKPDNHHVIVLNSDEFFIPQSENTSPEEQIEKLEEQLKYYQGFLNSVMRKLNNEAFVNNAKAEVVEKERRKKADAEAQIKTIEKNLKQFK